MIEIILPAMGEGIIEAEITRWLVSEGDHVDIDQPVVEVATDKVDSEIPSPASGVIQKIMLQEGDSAKVGQVMALVNGLDAEADDQASTQTTEDTQEQNQAPPDPVETKPVPSPKAPPGPVIQTEDLPRTEGDNYMRSIFLSPVIRKM